jgi:hypothetical protein
MAEESLPLELRLSLRAGSVFYFQSRELSSAEPHFFIVVNRDPLATKLLLLTIVTSQIDKVKFRNRERLQTVVEIAPAEYADFTKDSAIDGNVVLEKPLAELADMVRQKQVRYHRDLPPVLLEKIRAAITASPIVADEVKALL